MNNKILKIIHLNYLFNALKNSILEFMEEIIKNWEYEYFEFDRIGIIHNSNIFYHKIVNEKGKRKYYPFLYSIRVKRDKIKKIKFFDKIVE